MNCIITPKEMQDKNYGVAKKKANFLDWKNREKTIMLRKNYKTLKNMSILNEIEQVKGRKMEVFHSKTKEQIKRKRKSKNKYEGNHSKKKHPRTEPMVRPRAPVIIK